MPASSIGSYAAFLSWLVSLGPKLQSGWALIQAWIAATTAVVDWAKGLVPAGTTPPLQPGELSQFSLTDDERRLEAEAGLHIAGESAAFDGSILRKGWAFFQAHPELLTLLMSLLKGG